MLSPRSPNSSHANGGGTNWKLVSLVLILLLGSAWYYSRDNKAVGTHPPTSSAAAASVASTQTFTAVHGDPCEDTAFLRKEPQRAPSDDYLVLVTGGAGFIGSHLVELLLNLGYRVRILDNLSTGSLSNLDHVRHDPKWAKKLEIPEIADITVAEQIEPLMEGVREVYHLAAESKVLPSMRDPEMAEKCIETNVMGTHRVLYSAMNHKVRKVMYAASSTFYGNNPVPQVETMHPDLLTPYAMSKYEGELVMEMFDRVYKLPTLSLRFFMVYGERQPKVGAYAVVTGAFVRMKMEGKPLSIEGDGSHYRDFVHAADIARALVLGMQSDVHGHAINVGTGLGYSVKQVADIVSPNQVHVEARKFDLIGTLANTCQAKEELGFVSTKDFVPEMTSLVRQAEEEAKAATKKVK